MFSFFFLMLCVCTAGPMRSSSWRAILPGPLVCLWLTWWKASWKTCTKCTLCPHLSRWGYSEQAIHFSLWKSVLLFTSHILPHLLLLSWNDSLTLIFLCSLHLTGNAWSEGWSFPEHPLRPGQQRSDRCDSHDTEVRWGEAAGEECRDPVGSTEGAHPVKSAPLNPHAAWLTPSFYHTSCVQTANATSEYLKRQSVCS